MISDLLSYIFVERLSLNETAHKMGMSVEQLKDRLHIMEQMGYLRKADSNSSFSCNSCSSCKACQTSSLGSGQYMLTEKGSRLIELQ
ncbi:FeoC-like transcriptional regulator [uncultured Methanomethylovorans sp.]|uniref:FeoC-like transcriptional regulator n=1 Tax=uncultured Methanomethylovorans sp. TaxID=183759 RepID=UPI002AA7EEA2|nr:FeoC-like transcriptional regulator [uncultured Methanomethylovorans sp.]